MPKKKTAHETNTRKRQHRPSDSSKGDGVRRAEPEWLARLPIAIHQEVEVTIVGLNHDGEGVGYVDGYTLFVVGALPTERVRVKVNYVKKQYGYATLLAIIESSPERVQPPCLIYEACGGCQLQHLSVEEQLRVKRQHVVDSLQRIGKLNVVEQEPDRDEPSSEKVAFERKLTEQEQITADQKIHPGIVVHPTLGMKEPWRYRNKAQVPLGEHEGQLIGGFYARGSHDIIDMNECLIQHETNDHVVNTVKRIANRLGISAYREETQEGILRHVVVKVGFSSREVMVVLVTNSRAIPHVELVVAAICEAVPGVASICHNINSKVTNVILGEETLVLWGRREIYDTIGGVNFAISARSFFQVNPIQTEVLYGKVLAYAQLSGQETVIDAYCGIGTISLFLARRAGIVYGVEIVEEAIVDAKRNAELNGMSNVVFEAGPAERVLPEWQRQGIVPDVIVVDPPRKGCDPVLLKTMLQLQPKRIVYVSCNPATLARDLRILEDGGYRTVEVQPVDMFPHTVHVECVAKLERVRK